MPEKMIFDKVVHNKKSDSDNGPEEFIIAIGASAGGMEAIHTLFDHTPTDAVSYVIIQHLSPDHKSFMAELLSKHSKLKVYVIENDMEIKANCVYVMPEGRNMTISGGRLFLKNRQSSTPNSAVDIFFNSLAEDQGSKSIAIVLSGNGSDGTKGISAIKKVGGMVIVQDPESTEYKSMPNHAIESGNYDYILSPKLIPQQIINYLLQRKLSSDFSDPVTVKDETSLQEIIDLIKEKTPLDFSEYKRPTIIRRIIKRMMMNNVYVIEDYIAFLKNNPLEVEVLSKEFMISVTRFFRDPEAFEVIREKVIPEIIEHKLLVDALKVWVIGCATGEEVYSLAILIKEYLMDIKKDMAVKIFASDIDKDALAKASRGYYPESIDKDVSEKRLKDFFVKEGHQYKVKENIRNMIIFAEHDIVNQPPYGKIDFISCRNLLIYFNPTLQKKIFSTIHFCLNIGGYLFLGPSEGINELKENFREVDKKWRIYKNIESAFNIGSNSYSPPNLSIKQYTLPSFKRSADKRKLPADFSEIINKSNLEEAGLLAGICVDDNHKIIFPFGNFDKYLLPKLFNDDLLTLLPYELAIAVGTSIKKSTVSNRNVTVKDIIFRENDATRSVSIIVKPFQDENISLQKFFIVYFSEGTIALTDGYTEVFNKELFANRFLTEVEKELVETKINLKEALEALEDSTDNIQSYNEELLSGNEEMQSSNEELQSVNEELHTVNTEYQLKIKELAELNDDFNNYFRSTFNSQLYVDKNLIIKKFSPVSIKQINIKESDLGRPLSDISTNLKFLNLSEDINKVIATHAIREKQIETTDGCWYLMDILPYVRSIDGKSDGVIITFNDITDIKSQKY